MSAREATASDGVQTAPDDRGRPGRGACADDRAALAAPGQPIGNSVFRHGRGLIAERDGQVVGTGLRWRWGERHATIGLVIVSPACQGRRIGHRLMSALLDGLDSHAVLLHATAEGRGLYERLGFVRIGELRQHQGTALPTPPVALDAGWRLRPARPERSGRRWQRSTSRRAACRATR